MVNINGDSGTRTSGYSRLKDRVLVMEYAHLIKPIGANENLDVFKALFVSMPCEREAFAIIWDEGRFLRWKGCLLQELGHVSSHMQSVLWLICDIFCTASFVGP